MTDKILKIVKNKEYLTELLSKNSLEEIVEFCKSKGVDMSIDDVQEFVQIVRSLRVESEKGSDTEKLSESEILESVVGGYTPRGNNPYDTLDEEIKAKNARIKSIARTILVTAAGLGGIYVLANGALYLADIGRCYYTKRLIDKIRKESHPN